MRTFALSLSLSLFLPRLLDSQGFSLTNFTGHLLNNHLYSSFAAPFPSFLILFSSLWPCLCVCWYESNAHNPHSISGEAVYTDGRGTVDSSHLPLFFPFLLPFNALPITCPSPFLPIFLFLTTSANSASLNFLTINKENKVLLSLLAPTCPCFFFLFSSCSCSFYLSLSPLLFSISSCNFTSFFPPLKHA